MSVDERIRTGLRQAYQSLDPDAEAALARVESEVRRQRARRTVILGAAAAAAAVVTILVVGGSIESLSSQDETRPVDRPTDAYEDVVPIDDNWVQIDDPNLQLSRGLEMVVEFDGRLVAVGPGESPILTSTDGTEWSPADAPAAQWLDVMHGGPGLIAFGYSPDRRPLLWTSPDGMTWTPVDDPDGAFQEASSEEENVAEVADIVAGGPGFVAVGTSGDRSAVWLSSDGLEWRAAEQVPSTPGSLYTVRTGGAGLIAEGEQRTLEPISWTSVDGESWSPYPQDPVEYHLAGDPTRADFTLSVSLPAGPGLVAITHAADKERTDLWTSMDGQTWTNLPREQHGLDGTVSQVIEWRGEFIAVGGSNDGPSGTPWAPPLAVWSSTDGVTWELVAEPAGVGPPAVHISDVIATDTGLVAVGGAGQHPEKVTGEESGAVWVWEQP